MPAGITEEEGSGGEWNTFLHIQHTHIVYSSSLDIYRQHKIALSYWVAKKLVSTHIKSTMIRVDRCIEYLILKYSKSCNTKCLGGERTQFSTEHTFERSFFTSPVK